MVATRRLRRALALWLSCFALAAAAALPWYQARVAVVQTASTRLARAVDGDACRQRAVVRLRQRAEEEARLQAELARLQSALEAASAAAARARVVGDFPPPPSRPSNLD